MSTYNTGNPVEPNGSTDPRDLYDNSQNLDKAVNGDAATWQDRKDRTRKSWSGIEADSANTISRMEQDYQNVVNNLAPLGKTYPSLDGDAGANAAIASGEIPNGAIFFVRSTSNKSIADEYKNTDGVATFTGDSQPSTAFISDVLSDVERVERINGQEILGYPGIAEMATDSVGNITMQRLADGTTQFPALMIGNKIEQVQSHNGSIFQSRSGRNSILEMTDSGGISMLDYESFLSAAYPDYAEIYADQFGNIFKLVDRSGKVTDIRDGSAITDPVVSADGGLGVEESGDISFITESGENSTLTNDGGNINPVTFKTSQGEFFVKFASKEGGAGNYQLHRITASGLTRIRQREGKLVHVIIIGQSLSVGGATINQPAITVTPRYQYGAVTFNGGSKYDSTYPVKSVEESDLQYLVPIAEDFGKVNMQESDCSGLAERLYEYANDTCLVSATGSSGKSLVNISAGTDSFKATQLVMERAYEIASSLGMEYAPVMLFIHGNADAVAGVSGTVYKDNMAKLRADYENYYQSLTSDYATPLLMFVQQFSNANIQSGGTGADVNLTIGNAQYEICRDNPEFIMTGTQYARPYVDRDHLSNKGYRTDGEVAGVSIAKYIKDQSVLALRPDEANIAQTETEVTIPLLGGIGAAVIDTVRVVDPGNYGFRLVGATITGVTIDASNVVHIAKTGTATSVSYAFVGNRSANPGPTTGSRGCVRDSTTDVSPVSMLPIYNDLVAFNKIF
ncbi:hypothetical protein [Serratia fonticola]|uniref:hypothetical protein n=1 Tax=Serratia fonticola TaxID=47917 RepID=UPI00192CECA7|nr:hypothetical protein [Serratia fonticola]MBL5825435.1 hypothetical protein [Serratia fonticola]